MRQCDRCEAEGDETDIFAIDDRIWERYCEECRLMMKADEEAERVYIEILQQEWDSFYTKFYLTA